MKFLLFNLNANIRIIGKLLLPGDTIMSRSRLQNFEILRYKVRTLSDYSSSKRYTSISHLQQRSNEALTFTCSYKKKKSSIVKMHARKHPSIHGLINQSQISLLYPRLRFPIRNPRRQQPRVSSSSVQISSSIFLFLSIHTWRVVRMLETRATSATIAHTSLVVVIIKHPRSWSASYTAW